MNNDWREYTGDLDYYLAHHGIKGQHWGVRRFENENGTLTPAGKKRYETIDGKYQKVKAAKAKAKESYKEFNKDFNKAYFASQRLNITKKRKAERDALVEKARQSGQKSDNDFANLKKAKTDLKFTKKIAKNEEQKEKMLAKRAENREKIENKKSLKEKVYDLNAKAYDKLGNKTMASMNRAAAKQEHDKNADKRNVKLKDFDMGTKFVKAGYDSYSKTLKDYSKAKISSIGNKDVKKTDEYKSAAKAYRKQTANDLINGKTNTIAKNVINAAVNEAEKQRKKQQSRGNI